MADAQWKSIERNRALLADERGTVRKDAPVAVALLYPSPYRAAMSSLGYQTIYRRLNAIADVCADRAMLPDDVAEHRRTGLPLLTLERERPVGAYRVLAFSVAYELEIAGLIECLSLAGLEPLAADRRDEDPLVIAGGPLTFSNPVPLGPFVDAVAIGEGEELADAIADVARAHAGDRASALAALGAVPGFWLPTRDPDDPPPVTRAADGVLPARSQILTPNTELSSMFLTEAARGCSRGCTYCVMRRSTNGGMRIVEPDEILAGIPDEARRVGLVGAAVTDHPRIRQVVRGVVDAGRQVGISSLRADKLDDELVGLLARGGYRTLTVASDGASERMRRIIERSTQEKHLVRSAELARTHGMHTLKVYMVVGLPEETDDDIDELVRFTNELGRIHKTALGVAPFVAKRHTPLDGTPFAGIRVVQKRLDRLRKGLRGRASMRPTSARWAWVEYMLAQGDQRAGLAVLDAWREGGSFRAYQKAFADRGAEPTGARARVPSGAELIALHKRRRAERTPTP